MGGHRQCQYGTLYSTGFRNEIFMVFQWFFFLDHCEDPLMATAPEIIKKIIQATTSYCT